MTNELIQVEFLAVNFQPSVILFVFPQSGFHGLSSLKSVSNMASYHEISQTIETWNQICKWKFPLNVFYLKAEMILYNAIVTDPGGRLNKKDGLTRYGNSHVKDKTS